MSFVVEESMFADGHVHFDEWCKRGQGDMGLVNEFILVVGGDIGWKG